MGAVQDHFNADGFKGYYSEFNRYESWYGKAMDMAIEALQAEAEWIPCSERLPNEDEKGSRKKCKRV